MATALAVTQQQSSEVADRSWARIHDRDRCSRCNGLMVAEWCEDLSDHRVQRCVQCGEVVDPVILQNRSALQGPMTTQLAGKMLLNKCVTNGQREVGASTPYGVSR